MLYHITNRHNYQTCGATTGKGKQPEYNRWVEGNEKVKVLGVWAHQGLHEIYAVVESNDYQAVLDLTAGARADGTSQVLPVVDRVQYRKDIGFWGK